MFRVSHSYHLLIFLLYVFFSSIFHFMLSSPHPVSLFYFSSLFRHFRVFTVFMFHSMFSLSPCYVSPLPAPMAGHCSRIPEQHTEPELQSIQPADYAQCQS